MEICRAQSTSSNGFLKAAAGALVFASMLGVPTTSCANQFRVGIERTSSTPSNSVHKQSLPADASSTARGILAIRQMAGLTWDETARIFGVSRRTVHLWANGRHPSGEQERRLNRVLGILASYQDLGPSLLRQKLMASSKPGTLYFDLLCSGDSDAFQEAFVGGEVEWKYAPPRLSLETTSKASPSPVLLLDALQDRPVVAGRAIARKAVRLKRQET